jgi:hypothetical protein
LDITVSVKIWFKLLVNVVYILKVTTFTATDSTTITIAIMSTASSVTDVTDQQQHYFLTPVECMT